MDSHLHSYLKAEMEQGGQAYVRNLVAAEAAVQRGQFNVAKILRAMAHSQRVQAMQAARWLETEPDAAQLLDTIRAELENEPDLSGLNEMERLPFEGRAAVRQNLKGMLQRAIASLEHNSDVQESDVAQMLWGCYGCGSIFEGSRPEVCNNCGALAVEFEYFGPFYVSTREQLGRLSPAQIIGFIKTIPDEVAATISAANEEVLSRKPSPAEWSIKEIIGHMYETHLLFADKAHFLMQAQGMPVLDFTVPPWKMHEGKGYETFPVEELLDRLRQACRSNLELVQGLEPKDWLRRGTVRSLVTNLLDYGTWLTNHDRGHLAQIKLLCQKTD